MEQESIPTPSRPAKGTARVVDIPLDEVSLAIPAKRNRPTLSAMRLNRRDVVIDSLALVSVLLAVWAALPYLRLSFPTVDRISMMALLLVGVLCALIRGNYHGKFSPTKLWGAGFFGLLGFASVGWSFWSNEPRLALFGVFAALATWSIVRVRGEGIAFAISVGFTPLVLLLVEFLEQTELFETLQWRTVTFASGVSDMLSIPHVRESTTIVYGLGTADAFDVVGNWSGVLTLLGVAGFSILAFRRALFSSTLLTISTVFVWMAVRSATWIIIAIISEQSQSWTAWSLNIDIASFVLAILMVISVDHWLASVLAPIPLSLIVNDYPLFSMLWNWVCSLPKLELELPPTHHGLDPSPDTAELAEAD